MAWGLFEAVGGLVERARGFLSGIFGEAAREGIDFPTISEALEAGGLEIEIPELHEDFQLAERQTVLSSQIARLEADQLIPGDMHLETDRLLPHKFAYEVETTWIDGEGNETKRPYYIGSDTRLTSEEILERAEEEGDESPIPGTVAFYVGGITASWVCTEY